MRKMRIIGFCPQQPETWVGIEQTTYGLPARHSHLPGLNRKPIAYEAIALPIELRWLW